MNHDIFIYGLFTFCGIISASIVTWKVARSEQKRTAEKERYFKLYLPYILMIYRSLEHADFSGFTPEAQREFTNRLETNICYASKCLAEKIYPFVFNAFLFTEARIQETQFEYNSETEALDSEWRTINQLLISEYKQLSEKLHYTPLTSMTLH